MYKFLVTLLSVAIFVAGLAIGVLAAQHYGGNGGLFAQWVITFLGGCAAGSLFAREVLEW